ncbi:MAG: hypothetical protein ACD_39C01726G0005 [uncultured bacterium]|nr:MAG: hypothetical protein ACD_39C01726G0005 [uncultured bacterium]
MFSTIINSRCTFICFLFVCAAVLFSTGSVQAMSDLAPAFTHIEVEQVSAPDNFENTRRYFITYFNEVEGSKLQVFPTREEKLRDADLILARVVRQYLTDEYENQGKWMDEHVVEDSNLGKILDLVGQDNLSPAWHADNVNELRQYIHKYNDYLQLYTLHVYLDYKASKNEYYSGLDINPILLKLNNGNHPDVANFILVNYTDK